MILDNLEPKSVFRFFEDISNIPRPSFQEKAVSDYVVAFAKERNLEVVQDSLWNVIVKKPASVGYENSTPVIIQAHLDMVCDKNSGVIHDFSTDSLKLKSEGDFVSADGTTLGADDGIGVAYILAILDDKSLEHPAIEAIFTTSEESGMDGANGLDMSGLKGRTLLNLDGDVEGDICVSCAAGIAVKLLIPTEYIKVENDFAFYKLKIDGLVGGHSGVCIDLERANANCLMGRMLYELSNKMDLHIVRINGGAKNNAIPQFADAELCVNRNTAEVFKNTVTEVTQIIKNEYRTADPNINISAEEINAVQECMSPKTVQGIITALMLIPNGVIAKSVEIEGMVEASNNIGRVETNQSFVVMDILMRSSIDSKNKNTLGKISHVAKTIGAKVEIEAGFPGLAYNKNSKIVDICSQIYKKMHGTEAQITAIHAGLEGGIFCKKIPGLDVVNLGPNMFDIHSTNERLSILSTKRVWQFLVNILKELR